jgi:hypothetical protein
MPTQFAKLFSAAILSVVIGTTADSLLTRSPAGQSRVLMIDRCSTVVSGARATLIIGPLRRDGNIYTGDYQVKVSPYFFKGEKGKLAIVVSNESMTRVANGLPVEITGTATTSERNSVPRRIDATANPLDGDSGILKLWFLAGETKMTFDTSYRLAER